MKISGTCKACDRGFLISQVVEAGGSCPWCGVSLSPNYAITLVDRLADAVEAGDALEKALEEVADLGPGFTLDAESVVGDLRRRAGRLGAVSIRQG